MKKKLRLLFISQVQDSYILQENVITLRSWLFETTYYDIYIYKLMINILIVIL